MATRDASEGREHAMQSPRRNTQKQSERDTPRPNNENTYMPEGRQPWMANVDAKTSRDVGTQVQPH